MIATATVTAAVLPFVQMLAQKAAEDTYSGVRGWLREKFRESKVKRIPPGEGPRELLIVVDDDPNRYLRLYIPIEVSDRALRMLEQLDLAAEVARARQEDGVKVLVYWDEQEERWLTGG
ncbi:hypothetical protein OHR68_07035 [Spirillospora sp. NBC_00431]